MRVSLDEVRRLVKWLLRARGFRCGNEDEPADAVAWLAARRPGVLDMLWAELSSAGAPEASAGAMAPRILCREAERLVLDARGSSALTMAPLFLDWLVAAMPSRATVRVEDLVSPFWLLPHVVRRDALRSVAITAVDAGSGTLLMHLGVTAQRGASAALFVPWERLAVARVSVDAASGTDPCPPEQAALACVRVEDLDAHARRALTHGVDVDPELWMRMNEATRAAMVPETAASRRRGAGGGEDDGQ